MAAKDTKGGTTKNKTPLYMEKWFFTRASDRARRHGEYQAGQSYHAEHVEDLEEFYSLGGHIIFGKQVGAHELRIYTAEHGEVLGCPYQITSR